MFTWGLHLHPTFSWHGAETKCASRDGGKADEVACGALSCWFHIPHHQKAETK
jgi:hypothetical protein